MVITHLSDTHGYMPEILGEPDFLVHSGDFLPNRTFGERVIEESFQPYWIEQNQARLREWIEGQAILITHGNHDFIDTQTPLRAAGIEAYTLDDRRIEYGSAIFYGFPWVPEFGPWNRGCSEYELNDRLNAIDFEGVNVLVSHTPPYGVLDRNADGERCGSTSLRHVLQDSPHVPEYLLVGHIHESNGYQPWSRGIKISNAATIQRLITI